MLKLQGYLEVVTVEWHGGAGTGRGTPTPTRYENGYVIFQRFDSGLSSPQTEANSLIPVVIKDSKVYTDMSAEFCTSM